MSIVQKSWEPQPPGPNGLGRPVEGQLYIYAGGRLTSGFSLGFSREIYSHSGAHEDPSLLRYNTEYTGVEIKMLCRNLLPDLHCTSKQTAPNKMPTT